MSFIKTLAQKYNISANKVASYSITYAVWDEASIDAGDTDERGFELKNQKIEDQDALESLVEDMRELNEGEWSQAPIKATDLVKGHVWYSGTKGTDMKSGDKTEWGYHFKDLSLEQADYILKKTN